MTTAPITLSIRASTAPLQLELVDAEPLAAGVTPSMLYPATPVSADAGNIAKLGEDLGIYVGRHVHTQSSPATSWTVNHNLGRRPCVAILSTGGVEVDAAVTHVSSNQLTIEFVAAFAGQAVCI